MNDNHIITVEERLRRMRTRLAVLGMALSGEESITEREDLEALWATAEETAGELRLVIAALDSRALKSAAPEVQ